MSLSMYQASVPVLTRALGNLRHVLKQGAAHAKAKGGVARLAGTEPLKIEDNETTLVQLDARLERVIDYIDGFRPEQIDGSEERAIVLHMRSGERHFVGQRYLLDYVLPNVFFHCTTAYDILRQIGTDIGKKDFLGG